MIYNRQVIHIAVLLWDCIFSLLTKLNSDKKRTDHKQKEIDNNKKNVYNERNQK